MAQDNLTTQSSLLAELEVLTTDKTLDLYDTGKIFVLSTASSTGSYDITLPTAVSSSNPSDYVGWNATFLLDHAPSTGDITISLGDTSNDILSGSITAMAWTVMPPSAGTASLTYISNGAVAGDRCHMVCTAATNTSTTFIFTAISSQ